jgi:hypothetical protein
MKIKLKNLLKENVMADQLMAIDDEIWHKLGISDSDELEKKWPEYLKLVKQDVRKEFGGGKLSKSMYKELEAENHHSLNKALKELKYF